MTEKFHEQLDALINQVETMADLSQWMLKHAMRSLAERDTNLARQVIDKKYELSELDSSIEEKALLLTTLHQPMAVDMRTIGTILKVITYLYRIGRYGKDIAKVAIEIEANSFHPKLVTLPRMADDVLSMISDTIHAFKTGDLELIKDLEARDNSVDAQRYSIFRECISYMMEDPKTITQFTHYLMIARYLERCGDHACKMAEKIHYMVTGEHIEIS